MYGRPPSSTAARCRRRHGKRSWSDSRRLSAAGASISRRRRRRISPLRHRPPPVRSSLRLPFAYMRFSLCAAPHSGRTVGGFLAVGAIFGTLSPRPWGEWANSIGRARSPVPPTSSSAIYLVAARDGREKAPIVAGWEVCLCVGVRWACFNGRFVDGSRLLQASPTTSGSDSRSLDAASMPLLINAFCVS